MLPSFWKFSPFKSAEVSGIESKFHSKSKNLSVWYSVYPWWRDATNYKVYLSLTHNYEETSTVITKTYLYNFDPLKPHFYIVKLGFTGVYIIFHISAQNIDCGYSLELPQRGSSNEYPQSMFWAEIWKISEFFIWKFSVFRGEIFYIFE